MNQRNVILDTDIGLDIDDTWALGMLLNMPEFKSLEYREQKSRGSAAASAELAGMFQTRRLQRHCFAQRN